MPVIVRAPPPKTSEDGPSTCTTRVSKPLVREKVGTVLLGQRLRQSQVQSKLVNRQSRLDRTSKCTRQPLRRWLMPVIVRAPPPKTSEDGPSSTRTTRVSKLLVQRTIPSMFAKQRLRQSQAQPELVNRQTADISR